MEDQTATTTQSQIDQTSRGTSLIDENGYVGMQILEDLFSEDNMGQYWDGDKYVAGWRDGDATTQTTSEYPNTRVISRYWSNYRYIRSDSFSTSIPKDFEEPCIYQSSTASDYFECTGVGEQVRLYILPDTAYGSAVITVDGVSFGSHSWTTAPTETLIGNMESSESWSSYTGGLSADTVNYKQGTQSQKLTAGSLEFQRAELPFSPAKDFSATTNDYLKCWVYITNPANIDYVQILLDSTSTTSQDYVNFAFMNFHDNLQSGWNELIWKRTDMDTSGTINWASVKKVRLTLRTFDTGGATAAFDHLRFVTPIQRFSNSSLSFDEMHTIRVTISSGTVNVARIDWIASKKAIETYHRDTVLMVAPCHAALAAINGSEDDADKATKVMEAYRLYNQLGDRTAINRARAGDLGVGGVEQAYYITASNTLSPGEATLTSGGFSGIAMGLTYLVMERASLASETDLNNWKQSLQDLCDYWIRYLGYRNTNIYNYYNTGNANLLWGCTLYLCFLVTGLDKYRDYAYASVNAVADADPTDPLYHYWIGTREDTFSNGSVRRIRGYHEEHEEEAEVATSALVDGITATDTTIPISSIAELGISVSNTNLVLQIDNEMIIAGSFSGNNALNCTRGAFGSTAAAHSNGVTIRRGFDLGYMRVQSPAAYLFGVLTNDERYRRLGKVFWNSVEDRITPLTLYFDISGGSRNATVVEGYWSNGAGMNVMSLLDQDPYPSLDTVADLLTGLNDYTQDLGWIPGDTIALPAPNIVGTFPTASFALGWANCLKYLGYFD